MKILIVQNKRKMTIGIITDGQIRRFNQTNNNLKDLTVKKVMTTSPISIDQDTLAEKALSPIIKAAVLPTILSSNPFSELLNLGEIFQYSLHKTFKSSTEVLD